MNGGVWLQNGHLVLGAGVAEAAFGPDPQVSLAYYPDRHTLLLAGKSKAFFEKLHETQWHVLKVRNAAGDRSLMLYGLLIDHELPTDDRPLDFELKTTGILSIRL